MEKLISVATMRDSDAAEIASGTESKTLIYRAGLGLFRSCDWHGNIDIVAGSGNNAGDGYVLALLLHRHSIPCRIVCTSEKFSPDGAYFFQHCQAEGIPIVTEADFQQSDIIVDCLLGTGFHGELRPAMRNLVEQINASPAYVLSVDINSGMNGDTGEGVCVRSDCTVSIGTLKYGHILGLLAGKIGLLRNYDIGIPCRGAFLPLFSEDTAVCDFSPPDSFADLMDAAGVPAGSPAHRLQLAAEMKKARIRFGKITDTGSYQTL